jgi:membrane-bound serine protease (ClpP class)
MNTLFDSKIRSWWRLAIIGVLLSCAFLTVAQSPPVATGQQAWILNLSGAIGPASSDYINRTLDEAAEANTHLMIIEMDTPGGLSRSMRDIIQHILASPVPIVTFVYPQGSRAASAGTYILYASHVSAMAPATNLGAATPIQIGTPTMPSSPLQKKREDEKDKSDDGADAMQRKMINDAVAYIRGLAELHGRNADWAEKAVREAASLNAKEALKLGVIDLIAVDIPDLLKQLDGRTIQVQNRDYTIATSSLTLTRIEPDWRNKFLLTITNPNVAYILMLMGIYGLLLEFYNPGMGLPGVVGAISLLVALYALHLLPISYTGLALIGLGISLMVVEALSPSFGVFGLGGAVAFVVGSVMLMDSELPAFQIALPLIGAFTLVSLLIAVVTLGFALKARNSKIVSGVSILLGERAVVIEDFTGSGQVSINGEIWTAHCHESLTRGDQVIIQAIDGLILQVTKQES